MEPRDIQAETSSYTFGDRSSSDVIVRLRNDDEGLDERIYCHSKILTEQSKYFADCLSNPCIILDSRNSVEVVCTELDYDHHISLLKLLYRIRVSDYVHEDNLFKNVEDALGILCVAQELSCSQIVTACVKHLEAVPWLESEEVKIQQIIPTIGSEADPVLARLQLVDQSVVRGVFLSAFRCVTLFPPSSNIKASAQEQIDSMVTKDEDDEDAPPILIADEKIKLEVKNCVKCLFHKFFHCLEEISSKPVDSEVISRICTALSDLFWVFQVLTKMELCRDFVNTWNDTSEKLVRAVEAMETVPETVDIRLKVIEVSTKVLESVAYGFVVLSTEKRFQMVKLWLPFVRKTKPLAEDKAVRYRISGMVWTTLEASLVAMIDALPSSDQAEILNEWLSKEEEYPDLTVVFENWCDRLKVAKRRLGLLEGEEE